MLGALTLILFTLALVVFIWALALFIFALALFTSALARSQKPEKGGKNENRLKND